MHTTSFTKYTWKMYEKKNNNDRKKGTHRKIDIGDKAPSKALASLDMSDIQTNNVDSIEITYTQSSPGLWGALVSMFSWCVRSWSSYFIFLFFSFLFMVLMFPVAHPLLSHHSLFIVIKWSDNNQHSLCVSLTSLILFLFVRFFF